MITIRFASFVLAFIAMIALNFVPVSVASAVLALIFIVSFTVLSWTFGAFTKEHS